MELRIHSRLVIISFSLFRINRSVEPLSLWTRPYKAARSTKVSVPGAHAPFAVYTKRRQTKQVASLSVSSRLWLQRGAGRGPFREPCPSPESLCVASALSTGRGVSGGRLQLALSTAEEPAVQAVPAAAGAGRLRNSVQQGTGPLESPQCEEVGLFVGETQCAAPTGPSTCSLGRRLFLPHSSGAASGAAPAQNERWALARVLHTNRLMRVSSCKPTHECQTPL